MCTVCNFREPESQVVAEWLRVSVCVCVFVRCSPEILRFCVPTLGELKELNWVFHGSCKLDTTQKSRHSGIQIQLIGFLQQTASKPKSRKSGDRGSRRLTSSWNSAYILGLCVWDVPQLISKHAFRRACIWLPCQILGRANEAS